MDRVTSLASSNHLVSVLLKTQARLHQLEVQVTTEKVSQTYSGLEQSPESLMNLENTRDRLENFIKNNEVLETQLGIVSLAIDGAHKTINDFHEVLLNASGLPLEDINSEDIQAAAFRALKDLESHLNTDIAGRYLFAGARNTREPVTFDFTTLAGFQATYDGATVRFPETRDANLENFALSADAAGNANWLFFESDPAGTGGPSRITATTAAFSNIAPGTVITLSGTPGGANDGTFTVQAVGGGGTTLDLITRKFVAEAAPAATVTIPDVPTISAATTGGLTFASGANDTVTAANAGSLATVPVGSVFTVAGTANNDGNYTVLANDGTTITIAARKLSDQGGVAAEVAGTISATSYYSGDQVAASYRLDENRDVSFDLTGIDPAFEKAIRAMGVIAQGTVGSEGGLDRNLGRIDEAIVLLNSALDRAVAGPLPYGPELAGNLESISLKLGFQQVLVDEVKRSHESFVGFLENRVSKIEDIDPTKAISELLDQSRALEASFQTIARIRQLSLTNFL